jgi:hypothetical protein
MADETIQGDQPNTVTNRPDDERLRLEARVKAAPPELKSQLPSEEQVVTRAVEALRPVLQVMFNGVMVSTQAWGLPPDRMLLTLIRELGCVVGHATSAGGLTNALKIRRLCCQAFEDGVKTVTPQMTVQIPEGALRRATPGAALAKSQIRRN